MRERAFRHARAAREPAEEHRLGERNRDEADDDAPRLGGPVKDGNTTMDAVKKAADEYNKIGAVAAKSGIQQGLHNEGFELAMVDGERVYDTLFELLDPKLVKFQFSNTII